MQDNLIKFLLKVLDENIDKLVWEHLCYAPKGLYLKFIKETGIERFEMADFVAKWAEDDFNIQLSMSTAKDIVILRQLVMDKYQSAYPHLTRRSRTDHQGWMRVWVSSHMEKELQRR